MEIPFRVGEIVTEPHFVGRRTELTRLQQALWSRGGILLRTHLRTKDSLSELLRRWVAEVPSRWRQRGRLLDTVRAWGLRPEAGTGGGGIRLGIRERMLAPGEADPGVGLALVHGAGTDRLHSQDAAFAFDLPVSAAVSKAVRILRDKGHLTAGSPTRLADPFSRGWVLETALVAGPPGSVAGPGSPAPPGPGPQPAG